VFDVKLLRAIQTVVETSPGISQVDETTSHSEKSCSKRHSPRSIGNNMSVLCLGGMARQQVKICCYRDIGNRFS
jgi:hypothetical protein